MKITFRNLVRVSTVGFVATLIGLAGCKSSSDRTHGEKVGDRDIAKEIKKSLADDPTFKYSEVQPVVYDGNVQLTGFVETDEQRVRAADTAAHVKGTRQVINQIMIRPMQTGPTTIRDPLGHETGKVLLYTNAPPPRMHTLPPEASPKQQEGANPSGEGSNPKQ